MIENIKKFLNWEIILFILINIILVIYINIWPFLDGYFGSLFFFILEWLNKSLFDELNISFWIMLFVYLTPLFIIIKYLSLPLIIWIIRKFSKKEKIKSWIANITENNGFKIKIILIAIIIDIVALLINHLIGKVSTFMYLIFGGITGSYAALFLLLYVTNIIKKFSNRAKTISI